MRFGWLIQWLSGQVFILYFGGGSPSPRPVAAPRAALPAPAAIAPPKEKTSPVKTFNPESERKGTVNRKSFVIGSAANTVEKKTFGQKTTLGAGL